MDEGAPVPEGRSLSPLSQHYYGHIVRAYMILGGFIMIITIPFF